MSWEACGKVLKIDCLKSTDKFVLLVLAQYSSSETQSCWASMKSLARDCGCTSNTVRSAIERLIEKKLIKEVIERPGKTTIYVLDYERMDILKRREPDRRPLQILNPSNNLTPSKSGGVKGTPDGGRYQGQIEPEPEPATPSNSEDVPPSDFEPLQFLNPTPSNPGGVPLQDLNPNQDRNLDKNQEKQNNQLAQSVFETLREVPGIARATNATPSSVAEIIEENPNIPPQEWITVARSCRDWCAEWKSLKENSVFSRTPASILRDYLNKHPDRHGSKKSPKRTTLAELPEDAEAV